MGKHDDDEFMDELMMDVWDGLKEEPDSRKKGYPAKKKKKTEKQSEGKFYQLVGLIHGEVMHMPEKNTDPAVSEDQAMFFICFDLKKRSKNNRPIIRQGFKKIWNSWRKYVDKNGPKEYWVEEIKEEFKMTKEKKEMNLDELVAAANAQAEAVEDNNAVDEAQQEQANEIEENVNEVKEEIAMMDENKKTEQVEEQPIVIENAIPVASIVLETIAGNNKELSVALMPQDEKKGILQAVRKTDGEFENIGSYVIGGGYAFPLFRVSSKWFKKTAFSIKRTVDTTNRTIGFSGSKNYMSLLKLMFSDEEIEQAKAAEISRRFPPICQRSESKGVEKNIAVTVAINGETITLTGWVQREWRPLYLENADRTVTVRWDFGKGYQDPSIKFLGKMLRKNHDGVSGNAEEAKIFETIKAAILAKLDKA